MEIIFLLWFWKLELLQFYGDHNAQYIIGKFLLWRFFLNHLVRKVCWSHPPLHTLLQCLCQHNKTSNARCCELDYSMTNTCFNCSRCGNLMHNQVPELSLHQASYRRWREICVPSHCRVCNKIKPKILTSIMVTPESGNLIEHLKAFRRRYFYYLLFILIILYMSDTMKSSLCIHIFFL